MPRQTSPPPGLRRRCARHGRVPCSGIHSFTSIFGSRQTSERVPERKVTVHHSPGARESGKNSNAANIAESRPRVSPQHWGELANIFPSHSVSCAKAGADTPRFVPSAPRLRRCTAAAPRAPDPPTATRLRWRPRPRGSYTPRCAGANRRTSAPNPRPDMRHTTGAADSVYTRFGTEPDRVGGRTAFAKGLARPCGRIRFSTAPPCHDSATRHRYAIAGTIIERIGPYAGLLRRPAAHIGHPGTANQRPGQAALVIGHGGNPAPFEKGGNGGGGANADSRPGKKNRAVRSAASPVPAFVLLMQGACPEGSNAPNIDALRARVPRHHWGNMAIIFRQVSVSYGKAGADSRWLVPSAPGRRRAAPATARAAPDRPAATGGA